MNRMGMDTVLPVCHYVNVTFDGAAEGIHINHNGYCLKRNTPQSAFPEHHVQSGDAYINVNQTYGLIKRKTGIYSISLFNYKCTAGCFHHTGHVYKEKNITFQQLQYLLLQTPFGSVHT